MPGSGSLEPKRTCKLCAGRSARPQVDVVVSPRRSKVVAGSAGTQRRAASMGSMIRAPLGVFSGVAAAVKYTAGLYPTAASSGAVSGADGAGKGRAGGSDAGLGGGGENGGAVDRSTKDQGYFPTRIATGGLAALGRWRAGMGMSTEKPSEGPSASAPAAGAGGGETKVPTPGDKAGENVSGAGTGVIAEPSLEAADEFLTAPAPSVTAEITEGKAPASEDEAVGTATPDVAVNPTSKAAEELVTAPTPAAGAEADKVKAPASEDEADVGTVRTNTTETLPRAREGAAQASGPAVAVVVADVMSPASGDEMAETSASFAAESPQSSPRVFGAGVAETKAPELANKAEIGAVRADVAWPSSAAAIEDAWMMVEGDMAAEAPIEVSLRMVEC